MGSMLHFLSILNLSIWWTKPRPKSTIIGNSPQNYFPKHPKYMQVLTSTADGGVCKIVGRANLLLISLKLSAKKHPPPPQVGYKSRQSINRQSIYRLSTNRMSTNRMSTNRQMLIWRHADCRLISRLSPIKIWPTPSRHVQFRLKQAKVKYWDGQ